MELQKEGGIGDEKVSHGGICPPGQIYDHKKSSPTHGQCIPLVVYKEREAMNGLKLAKDNFSKV